MSVPTETRNQALLSEALGPLEALLDAPGTAEVIVNEDGRVWHEQQGGALVQTGAVLSVEQRYDLIYTVAGLNDKVVTRARPSLSGVLPGRRVRFQGEIPPASSAPNCSLRRLSDVVFPVEHYLTTGMVQPWQMTVIAQAIAQRQNILLAGKTGSGKTTFLNTLLYLTQPDRIVTIEDTAELLPNEYWSQSYVTDTHPMGACIKEVLRKRPDRVISGEVRGVEAIDMLEMWGTGHPGGLGTTHAATPRETLARVETCMRQVSPEHPHPLPLEVARDSIARTIQLIICLTKDVGRRAVSAVARVHGLQGGDYTLEMVEQL